MLPAPATSAAQFDAATGVVTGIPTTNGATTVAPRRFVAVATDGQVWFTARFTPQAVGRLNPANNPLTLFPADQRRTGQGIAASPDGTIWFTRRRPPETSPSTEHRCRDQKAKTVKGSAPFGIAVADTGNPWYTMPGANKIATLQLR